MSNTSDYNRANTDLFDLLPSVYQSDVSKSLLKQAFNRFLTKEEMVRVAGYIGQGNPSAVIKRQIIEPTPHRQAYQLQPLLYSKIGTVEYISAYKDILGELERLGVDLNRLPLWGDALKFNWVPPVDLDKLINYLNYYWYDEEDSSSVPDYVVIENRCTRIKAKVHQYELTLRTYGDNVAIVNINSINNTITVSGKYSDLFTDGFKFFVKSSTDINGWWTTASSVFDVITGLTTITIVEPLGVVTVSDGIVSFTELLDLYKQEENCICDGSSGWDSSNYDTQPWDGCGITTAASTSVQTAEQWIRRNKWYHKNEVPNFAIAKQAKIPIIEYNSQMELSGWIYGKHVWKYRSLSLNPFSETTAQPTRFELVSPQFTADFFGLELVLDPSDSACGDLTDIFVPGYQFMVPAPLPGAGIYTVKYSLYKEITPGQPYNTVITIDAVTPTTLLASTSGNIVPYKTNQGDDWVGYHTHWLYVHVEDTLPINNQLENIFLQIPVTATVTVDINNNIQSKFGLFAQEYFVPSIALGPRTTFTLDTTGSPSLQTRSLLNSGNTRVYIDGIRQYGNYLEKDSFLITAVTTGLNGTFTVAGNFTGYFATGRKFSIAGSTGNNGAWVVQSSSYNIGLNTTVITVTGTIINGVADGLIPATHTTGIIFNSAVPLTSTVRIEVGEAAQLDLNLGEVPVRTVEDNNAFNAALVALTQPVNIDLTSYKKIDQVKTKINQYPLYNMYRVDGTPSYKATSLFAYKEDSSYPIHPNFGRRIVVSSDGKDYTFEQYLLEEDTKVLYAYRDYSLLTQPYWYDTNEQRVKVWDSTWNYKSRIGTNFIAPVVSNTDPIIGGIISDINGLLWYDTLNSVLNRRVIPILPAVPYWVNVPVSEVSNDLTLQTIWKKGLNNETYVPKYVDKNREEINVGNLSGDWELAEQLYYNPSHENRKEIRLVELLNHCNSIITSQPYQPGYLTGGLTYLLNWNEVNYGLGGTIREYNDSYDTFLSSIYNKLLTPISLIDFAQEQYEILLDSILTSFRQEAIRNLVDTSVNAIANSQSIISSNVITQHEQNDAISIVYGDSTTYANGIGMRNWIATLPFLGLVHKVKPSHIVDSNLDINEIIHHDGHHSHISLPSSVVLNIIRTVINTTDTRATPTQKLGKQSSTIPPQTTGAYLTNFNSLRSGVYWYQVVGSNQTLWRFNVSSVSLTPPSSSLPDGTLWYDTTTSLLKEKSGVSWIPVTGIPNDISMAWVEIDINYLAAEVILDIETRLYDAAPILETLVFDFNSLTPNISEQAVYDQYYQEAFNNYIQQSEIIAPYNNEIIYNSSDAFTWNYKQCTIGGGQWPYLYTGDLGGTWQDLYQRVYGTPYPHLEPWVLQGFTGKPTWWDTEYKDLTLTRRWIYNHATTTGMWENIRTGQVPAGQTYPDGNLSTGNSVADNQQLPTYVYFSVNIANNTVSGYGSDELFPPYVSGLDGFGIEGFSVRSIFYDLNTQIINPGADYNYGDSGLQEWKWKISSRYLYDRLLVAFRMQPVRFIHYTMGNTFIDVQGLQVESVFEKVLSHLDTIFHGDIFKDTQTYTSNGLNQWYINYNRYYDYDTSSSIFRQMWVGWEPKLSYQFASIIDTQSFDIGNKNFDLLPRDYLITLKKSLGVDEKWIETFAITALSVPPQYARYENQNDFKFEFSTQTPISRQIQYYDVRNYPFYMDTTTGICTLYKYQVSGVNITNNSLSIKGNQIEIFTQGRGLTVAGSTGNNGNWVVSSSVYIPSTDTTVISVTGDIINPTVDGFITAQYRLLPWNTGDIVYLSSSKSLPSFIDEDMGFFVNKISSTTFKICYTYDDAINNVPMLFSSTGTGQLYVGELTNTFTALGGASTSKAWRHYTLDKTNIKTFTSPSIFYGVQTIVNILDGYIETLKEDGFSFNFDSTETDPDTGRVVNWQVETERFIDWAYHIRITRAKNPDTYAVTVEPTQDVWTFTGQSPLFTTGTKVIVVTKGVGAVLPAPVITNTPYYFIRVDDANFKLASTLTDAKTNNPIDVLTLGSGQLSLQAYEESAAQYPSFEINPVRNNIWLGTETGIVSNVLTGPYPDVRIEQLIFDQYGRAFNGKNLSVYRLDKITHITTRDNIPNDVDPIPLIVTPDPYNYLHFGGAHLFIDGYEHVIIFNNYTTTDDLIYDPFIGLNTSKFEVDFKRSAIFTYRPNAGGYVIQNDQLARNIEASVIDLQKMYDAFEASEAATTTEHVRKLLGYDGPKDYMRQISINPKSQFLFWRGMIQNKGSVNSVKAFINSRRFIDAKIDEFWAYKIAEYGDSREKTYPQLNLFTTDSVNKELRLEFGETPSSTFEGVTLLNEARWYEYPNEYERLKDKINLYFDADITSKDDVPTFISVGANWFYVTNEPCDAVVITKINTAMVNGIEVLVEGVNFIRINSRVIKFTSDPSSLGLVIYTVNPAKAKLNPAKIIDVKASTVVHELPVWDPVRGFHYHNAYKYIDNTNMIDPATYTNTLLTASDASWESLEVGIKWLDMSQLSYVPYYDDKIFSTYRDQSSNWGLLADWALVDVYEWTESDVPPAQYTEDGVAKKSVFYRTRTPHTVTTVNIGPTNTIDLGAPGLVTNGQRVTFTTTGTPIIVTIGITSQTLDAGTFYYVINVVGNTFQVSYDGITPLTITSAGTGAQSVAPAFNNTWSKDTLIKEVIHPSLLTTLPTIPVTLFTNGDIVNVYVNGKQTDASLTVTAGSVTTTAIINSQDIIEVIKFEHTITSAETSFNPDSIDNGTVHIQWKEDYEYSIRNIDIDGILTPKYYFWVGGKTVRPNGDLALVDIEQQLTTIPSPFITFHKVVPEETAPALPSPGPHIILPNRYTQAVVHKIGGIVVEDNRYILRFTKDFTLRDSTDPSRKNVHEEWEIFRQEQPYNIPRALWDRVVESIVGYKLTDSSQRVPTLERELYDDIHGTDTQYGLGDEQAFVSGELALASILAYLKRADNDFSPQDISIFLETYPMDTAQSIIDGMAEIYNTFPFYHVNRIFFETLLDAFSTKNKYPDIFKTSMVALHGIRILETSGEYDD